jgi:hypothetical protein
MAKEKGIKKVSSMPAGWKGCASSDAELYLSMLEEYLAKAVRRYSRVISADTTEWTGTTDGKEFRNFYDAMNSWRWRKRPALRLPQLQKFL